MFTGIVEAKGKTTACGHGELVVASTLLAETAVGASVSVDGVCLTVVEQTDAGTRFDVVPETLERTNLGALGVGDEVNLERAMPATGRFDGHVVQGHVDGTGTILGLSQSGGRVTLTVRPPKALMSHIVEKGSITIDGVSLTVAGVSDDEFDVALVPHTLESTTLGGLRPGDSVNLETDVIAKYLERLLEVRR